MEQPASEGYSISITEDTQSYFKNNEIHLLMIQADGLR